MRLVVLSSAGVVLASTVVWVACSSSGNPTSPAPTPDSGPAATDAAPSGPFALAIPCTDSIASVYGDPGTLPPTNGAIIKCAKDADIAMSDLLSRVQKDLSQDDAPATNGGYVGKPFTSGAHVYRILYRTERGDDAKSPGYSSATVYIPDTPRAAGKLPMIVGAHGTWGQAGNCPVDEGHTGVQAFVIGDYENQAFPMVGLGYPIIMPDLAGYSNFGAAGNPPSGYAQYNDVGKSTLDGARALAQMFPDDFSGKVAILGHSQGGHSALSAVAIQPTYAPDVKIAAVATYSPLWLSQRSWGAILYTPGSYPMSTSPLANAVSIWYHYTHGELLDGPGHGLDVFAADKQDVIKKFVANDCEAVGWDGLDAGTEFPDLQAAGSTLADFFDPAFAKSIKNASALGNACPTVDGGVDPVCTKWIGRYLADRPHFTAAVPPMLIEYGDSDDVIDPGRMACVTERLKQDKVAYTFCLNPGLGHASTLRHTASYVADWIGSKTLGEAAPAACAESDANLVDDAGVAIPCTAPPPND